MAKPTGVYCPLCDKQSILNSQMLQSQGAGGIYTCSVQGHKIEYSQLMALKPRMQQLVITEKQPMNTITQSVWIYPEAIQRLKDRYPTNLMTTLCAIMTALADEDTLLIEGEQARKLRELGVKHGRDIVGLAETNKALSAQLDAALAQQKSLEPMLKLIQVLTGNNPVAQEAIASAGLSAAASTTLPSRSGLISATPGDYEPTEDEMAMAQEQMAERSARGSGLQMPKPVPSGR